MHQPTDNPRFRSRIRFPVRDKNPLEIIENVDIAGPTAEFYSFFQRVFSAYWRVNRPHPLGAFTKPENNLAFNEMS